MEMNAIAVLGLFYPHLFMGTWELEPLGRQGTWFQNYKMDAVSNWGVLDNIHGFREI